MTKHVADHRAPSSGGRTKAFAEVERQNGPEGSSAAVQELMRRPHERGAENRRAQEFVRIDKGEEA